MPPFFVYFAISIAKLLSVPRIFRVRWRQPFVCDRASVAAIFALSLIPAVVLVGAAIDYSRANALRSKFNASADEAALAAVGKATIASTTTVAKDTALKVFSANAPRTDAAVSSPTVTINDSTSGRSVVVSYSADVPTYFMQVLGIKKMPIGGSATATSVLPTYIDFYLMLDNTPSMGVGATTSDINTMVLNTPDQCAFACHDLSTSPNDYYGLAKSLAVQMRIDVVRQATQQLMDTARTTQAVSGQFRMAIYTFGSSARNLKLTTIQSLTSNLTDAKASAENIDLMTVPYQNYADDTDTDFGKVFASLNTQISDPGNGGNGSTPQKYVFFVSDGVADRAIGSPGCSQSTGTGTDPQTKNNYIRCQEPIDVSLCATLKNRGIKIAVLYTTYLPLPTNSWYNTWISPFSEKIAANMQSCASPGLYFEVSPTSGISEAMSTLFQKVVQQARLVK